jgi:triphosphatase
MKPEAKSLAEFATEQAEQRLKTLLANLHNAAEHPGEAGGIHDLRVSIRRFTRALRLFRDLWDPRHYRKMRRQLRKLMDLCGAARNCDVAMEILESAAVPASSDLKTYLRKRRSHAERNLAEQLARSKSRATMRPWPGWLRVPSGKNQGVQPRARQILRPLLRQYGKAGSLAANPGTSPDQLHQLRLLAKRLRYSLEIFGGLSTGVSGVTWEQEIERVREVQDLLGAINDCVTTSGLVAKYGHTADVRQSTAGLKNLLRQRLAAFQEHWRTAGGSNRLSHKP